MTKGDVVRTVLDGQTPPYVPWSFSFTKEAAAALVNHYGTHDLDPILQNHMVYMGNGVDFFTDLGHDRVRDVFGVVWDRSIDKDIGVVTEIMLPEPDLSRYEFPDPLAEHLFTDLPGAIATFGDRFKCFQISFSLYERAWTLRGMENLMMDFYTHPEFVRDLFNAIADYNIAQIRKAVTYDIDGVIFGDDWGQQFGLQMGVDLWREFIHPVLERMYGAVREAGKYVLIHSCGDVDELFDDLIAIGLQCFNPFQPEVMDVAALVRKYRGRLAFHGGLSTPRTLPFGTVDEVRHETQRLIDLGRDGGLILAPAHGVKGDVSVANMLAFIEQTQCQPGWNGR